MRVDRWLWTARLFKTRAQAAEAVKGGRVHVNGVAAKPSREVRVGDELEVTVGQYRRTVIVAGAAERRVSAPEAAKLYAETTRASPNASASGNAIASRERSILAAADQA